jgi:hypothetical protein
MYPMQTEDALISTAGNQVPVCRTAIFLKMRIIKP